MKNPICISTGPLYKVEQDRNIAIQRLRQFPIDGVELSFVSPDVLFGFIPTNDNLDYLRRTRTSIHAPWRNIAYGENPVSIKVLDSIQELYDLVNAKNVTFHKAPADDFSVLQKYSFVASIENDDWKKIGSSPTSPEEIARELARNPFLYFTFDFAHADTVDPTLIPIFLQQLKARMSQVHLSYHSRDLSDHHFLVSHPHDKGLIKLIPQDLPIVLEGVASDESEVPLIAKEIKYLRSL